jgi:hypothetical protein
VPRHAAGVVQSTAEEHLYLRVEAAQIIGGPPGERVMDGGIESQWDLLALAVHV